MTSREVIEYIHARSKEVGQFFNGSKKQRQRVPKLQLENVDSAKHTSPDFRVEAWTALNKKIVANSMFEIAPTLPRTSSISKSGRKTPLPSGASDRFDSHVAESPPRYIEQQVAEHTAPLLNPRLMMLEATEAISEKQLAHGQPSDMRKRALEASARKQLRLVHEGAATARSQTRVVNPFRFITDGRVDDRESVSRMLKSRSSTSVRGSTTTRYTSGDPHSEALLSGKFRELNHKYFEGRLLDMDQRESSARQDVQMRFSLLQLKKCANKTDIKLKPEHTQEAVARFKEEKLAFVYGPQFRGRYISRTHGDLLK